MRPESQLLPEQMLCSEGLQGRLLGREESGPGWDTLNTGLEAKKPEPTPVLGHITRRGKVTSKGLQGFEREAAASS